MAELTPFLKGLGVPSSIAGGTLVTLATFVAGMVLYSVFVFKLYKFVARKDIFELNLTDYARGSEVVKNAFKIVLYFIEYIILFPILTMVWFLVFAELLALLSSTHTVGSLLLVSMAVVTTIRVCAYYNSDLAEDVGKTLPLALLGIVLVDGFQQLSLSRAVEIASLILGRWSTVLQYLGFIMVLELILRALTILFRGTVETEEVEEEEEEKKEEK